MEPQYDRTEVLDLIRRREGRLSRNGSGLALGHLMVRAAEDFVRNPCLTTLDAFAAVEDEWRALQPTARQRYANAFRLTLGLPSPPPGGFKGNTPFNNDWNPARGFVYGFWSADRYGVVKLGATTQHPSDRLEHFKRKYALSHVEIAFFFEVQRPREVELDWTKSSRSYRCSLGRSESREWYALTPAESKRHVLESIRRSGVKRLGLSYVFKNIDHWKEVDFWPQGPKRLNSTIVAKG